MALDKHDLLFSVKRSVRYHDRRLGFFEKMHQVTSVLTILLSGSILLQIAGAKYEPPLWLVLISLSAAILAAIDMVVGYAKMANIHRVLKQKFFKLEIDLLAAKTNQDLNDCKAKRIEIELDEPPIYRALDLLCHNEVMVSEGYDPSDQAYIEVGMFKRLTSNILHWSNIGHDSRKIKKKSKITTITSLLLILIAAFIGSKYVNNQACKKKQADQVKSQVHPEVKPEVINKLSDRDAADIKLRMQLDVAQA